MLHLLKLSENEILHIDLVYTKYNFDQQWLNKKRLNNLKELLPQIDKEFPTIRLVEQSGATDAMTAKSYFHGFVIHYGKPLTHQSLQTFFSKLQKENKIFIVKTEKEGTFKYASGTKIHMPANAVTYANGKPVKGFYELKYREFRNPVEIAFSGLPMTYHTADGPYNFSSVGMYEIRAEQNGQQLKLQKPVTIDFNATKQAEGVGFFKMNDETGKWEKLQDIKFKKKDILKEEQKAEAVQLNLIGDNILLLNQGDEGNIVQMMSGRMRVDFKYFSTSKCNNSKVSLWLNQEAMVAYQRLKLQKNQKLNVVEKDVIIKRIVIVAKNKAQDLVIEIFSKVL